MISEKIDVRETHEIAHFHHRIEVQIVVISSHRGANRC